MPPLVLTNMHRPQPGCWAHTGSGDWAARHGPHCAKLGKGTHLKSEWGDTEAGPICDAVLQPEWFKLSVYLKVCLPGISSSFFNPIERAVVCTLQFLKSYHVTSPVLFHQFLHQPPDIILLTFHLQFVSIPHKTIVGTRTGCKLPSCVLWSYYLTWIKYKSPLMQDMWSN